MSSVLVDSNVVLDVLTDDPQWSEWSSSMLARCAESAMLIINPIIYAEVSVSFQRIEELDEVVSPDWFRRDPLPWEAAFLAGKCFLAYRRKGGSRRSPLPDFYIGAHAAVKGLPLLTRDPRRYRTYFPHLRLLAPEEGAEQPEPVSVARASVAHQAYAALTDREREVVKLLVNGIASNRRLAKQLGVSENTVKLHIRSILDKLHLSNRAQVSDYVLRHGIVEPPAE